MPKGKGYPMPKYTPKSASKPGNPHKSYGKGKTAKAMPYKGKKGK